MQEKEYSLTEQSIILMTGKGLGFVIAFFIPLIVVRLTTPEGFGTYKQFFLIFTTVFSIAQLGLSQSLYYFVPGNPDKGLYISQAYIVLVICGLFVTSLLWVFRTEVASLLNNQNLEQYVPIAGVYTCFMLAASFLEGSLIAELKTKAASFLLFFSEFIKAAAIILPTLLTGELKFLFIGATAFAFIRFVTTSIYVKKFIEKNLKAISRETVGTQMRYAAPLAVSVPFFILSAEMPNYFVSHYFPTEVFALFAVALFYPPVIEVIETPIIEPMFVAMVSHLKKGENEPLKNIWHNSIRKLSLALLPILAFSFAEADLIIGILFTAQYISAVPIFRISIFRIFFAIFIPDNVIKAHGQPSYILKTYAFTLIATVVFLMLFIDWFGLIGAAIAIICREFFMLTLMVHKARSFLRLPFHKCLPWKHLAWAVLISFICTLPGYLLDLATDLNPVLMLLISFSVFIFFYGIILMNSTLLTKNEKKAIYSFLGKVWTIMILSLRRTSTKNI
jgi:O-antigen/teichoic acid export membrane protein